MRKKSKGSNHIFLKTILIWAGIIAASAVILMLLMGQYEKGILDVCAVQQDGYVQLVLDQINLKENRDDEEIINEILGTLDSSNNRYWTFARGQAMVFVKDVLETNKYKNFNTESYYDSESAREFLDSLEVDRVNHAGIEVDGMDYIASGVAFSYGGEEYRLCLLTNRSVLLDNNYYLGARVELLVMLIILAVAAFLTAASLSKRVQNLDESLERQLEADRLLNMRVEALNNRISESEIYAPENRLWGIGTLPVFLEKLKSRDCWPLFAALISCRDEEYKKNFSLQLDILHGEKVICISASETELVVFFLRLGREDSLDLLDNFLAEDVRIVRVYTADSAETFNEEIIMGFIKTEE